MYNPDSAKEKGREGNKKSVDIGLEGICYEA